jgi:phosphoribosylanthranilate isomerase
VSIDVKICGLKDPVSVRAAVDGGAAMVGFVFFPPSPRSITAAGQAELSGAVPDGILKIGLVVNPEDAFLKDLLATARLDMLQLHGLENPERVGEIRERFGLPVMKAVAIAGPKDIVLAHDYEGVTDRLLFDARPPKGASRPGGNAQVFDWTLLRDQVWQKPWLLAGGLRADNLVEAVRTSGAAAVDISSGVEDSPGMKNPDKISAFLEVAATL